MDMREGVNSLKGINENRLNRRKFLYAGAAGVIFAIWSYLRVKENKDYELFLEHPLAKIAQIEAEFGVLRKAELDDYMRKLYKIKGEMLSGSNKAEEPIKQLKSMCAVLKRKGYELSSQQSLPSICLYEKIKQRSLDCDVTTILMGLTLREDRSMDIIPFLAMSPVTDSHVVLKYNGDNEFLFDPLLEERLNDDNYEGEYKLYALDLLTYELKKDGFFILAYSTIGKYFYRATLESKKRGDVKNAKENIEKARRAFEFIVKADPNFHCGHKNLGFVLCEAGDYDKAKEHFMVALPDMDKFPNLLIGIGECYIQDRNYTEARRWFEKALERCNKYPEIFKLKIPELERAILLMDQKKEIIP